MEMTKKMVLKIRNTIHKVTRAHKSKKAYNRKSAKNWRNYV